MNNYNIDLQHTTIPPNYSTLLHWWDAWPEARPELLDFWARGNYSRRILSRNKTKRSACIVRIKQVDEMEAALKRLALLDIDVDFAWCGQTTQPQLVIVPQDIDYEDSGGWGYTAASGSRFSESRDEKDWCPSIGWASLLPDTVTDWLADEARPYIQSGKIMVSPVSHIGLSNVPVDVSEEQIQKISNSASIIREQAKIKSVFDLELPYLEGMSIQDIHRFCENHRDHLILFQKAIARLLQSSIEGSSDSISQELVSQIREEVAKLRLSNQNIDAQTGILTLGGSIATFTLTGGIMLRDIKTVGAGCTAAMTTLKLWSQILNARNAMRKNPFYIIWALQRGKDPRNKWHNIPFSQEFPIPPHQKPKVIPPFHWLAPPTAGWRVPTCKRMNIH